MTDKNIFFIFSPARCRSTWFANFFTYKNSFCYNEESRYMSSLTDISSRIERREETNIGFSDPEMFHYIKKIHKDYPEAKFLFLERNIEESIISLHNVSKVNIDILRAKYNVWSNNINYLKKNVNHHCINFDDMDNRQKVKECWDYILPNEKFDDDRFDLLTSMVIKVTIANKPNPIVEDTIAPYFDMYKLHQTTKL